jgi:hypothetical protein
VPAINPLSILYTIPYTHDPLAPIHHTQAWQTHSRNGQCSQSHFLRVYELILSDGVSAPQRTPRPRHLQHLIDPLYNILSPLLNHLHSVKQLHPRMKRKQDINGAHRPLLSERSGPGARTPLHPLRLIELLKSPRDLSQAAPSEDLVMSGSQSKMRTGVWI